MNGWNLKDLGYKDKSDFFSTVTPFLLLTPLCDYPLDKIFKMKPCTGNNCNSVQLQNIVVKTNYLPGINIYG